MSEADLTQLSASELIDTAAAQLLRGKNHETVKRNLRKSGLTEQSVEFIFGRSRGLQKAILRDKARDCFLLALVVSGSIIGLCWLLDTIGIRVIPTGAAFAGIIWLLQSIYYFFGSI